jgi:pilus assembly protein CpaF
MSGTTAGGTPGPALPPPPDAAVMATLAAAGPLAPLLRDAEITDVLVNGVEVWVDRAGELHRTTVRPGSREEVRRMAQRLAALCGRRLDDAAPCVDARLPDGTRLHAVLPPIARNGPYLSLRVFRPTGFTLDDLVRVGALTPDIADLLAAVVAARLSYVVTGGAGAGKTSLLSTLLALVPPDERIVVVEDSAELCPVHPHVVALEARTSNVENSGCVPMRELVRHALRMRPDRLVVGECRGGEVVDWLAALNTGHSGGAGTLHANSPADVPARLEALGLLGGLPRAAVHAQVAAALHVVLHVRRTGPQRVLDEVCVLVPGSPVTAVTAWRRGEGSGPGSPALVRLLAERGVAS